MTPLGIYLHKITEPSFKSYGFYYTKILSNWTQIIGIKLAQYTIPKKIAYYNETSILFIETINSSSATELYYLEPMIIEKLATYLGSKAITRLKIIQNPLIIENPNSFLEVDKLPLNTEQKSHLCSLINLIEDLDLREELYKLGEFIYISLKFSKE